MGVSIEDSESKARAQARDLTALFNTAAVQDPAYHRHTSIKPGVTRDDILTKPFRELFYLHDKHDHGFLVEGDSVARTLQDTNNPALIQKVQNSDWDNISDTEIWQLRRVLENDQPKFYDYLGKKAEKHTELLRELGVKIEYNEVMRGMVAEYFDPNHFHVSKMDGFKRFLSAPQPEHIYVKIPAQNFNIKTFLERVDTHIHYGPGQTPSPPPGSNQEWAFIIAAHELEHAGGHKQSHIDTLVEKMRAQAYKDNIDFSASDTRRHLEEIEADIASAEGTRDLVDPAIHQYWASHRIATANEEHMKLGMKQAIRAENGDNFYLNQPVAAHDTGFHLDEYLQTGMPQNYMEMQTNVQGFYLDTAQFLRTQMREHFKDMGQEAQFNALAEDKFPKISVAETMHIVQEALKAEPAVYTPEEMQIATRYLKNMQDLGLTPVPPNAYKSDLEVAVKQQPAPAADPDQNAAAELPKPLPEAAALIP